MAKAPKGTEAPAGRSDSSEPATAFERMRDLTRRVVRVPKSDLPKAKPAKRKRSH